MEKFVKYRDLATYACDPKKSRGRFYTEEESSTRSVYQRDRDRIIHSAAFRRLEYKTQVFVNHEGDHFRTRLTHSLEVAQISRSVSRELGLNEDLAETLALAHDLGHPPFGHAGEDALKECMANYGGFDHNAHTIRILTALESKYIAFDGLNLTWETLEGVAKHNGPLVKKAGDEAKLPRVIKDYNAIHDLELGTFASAEAQVASLSDDIAYNNHDIDDGFRAGLFTLDDLAETALIGPVIKRISEVNGQVEPARLLHESVRRVINMMVSDLIAESKKRLKKLKACSPGDVRSAGQITIAFSDEMSMNIKSLKSFLMDNMYRHYRVNRMTSKARRLIKELFNLFLLEPECLPNEWRKQAGKPGSQKTAEVVCDFIAGMTDRFAIDEHRRLFDIAAKS